MKCYNYEVNDTYDSIYIKAKTLFFHATSIPDNKTDKHWIKTPEYICGFDQEISQGESLHDRNIKCGVVTDNSDFMSYELSVHTVSNIDYSNKGYIRLTAI